MTQPWVDRFLIQYCISGGIALVVAGVLILAQQLKYGWLELVILGIALLTIGVFLQLRFVK